jgi:two-component system, OmpR family, response regulator CiaR
MGDKKKILVIDNDKDILETIKNVLERTYDVQTANDSKEGIYKSRFDDFDLVLIDLHMGSDLSGYKILEQIRKKGKGKPKLIYISVIPKKEVDLKGVDGFIQKPFEVKEFLAQVSKYLK